MTRARTPKASEFYIDAIGSIEYVSLVPGIVCRCDGASCRDCRLEENMSNRHEDASNEDGPEARATKADEQRRRNAWRQDSSRKLDAAAVGAAEDDEDADLEKMSDEELELEERRCRAIAEPAVRRRMRKISVIRERGGASQKEKPAFAFEEKEKGSLDGTDDPGPEERARIALEERRRHAWKRTPESSVTVDAGSSSAPVERDGEPGPEERAVMRNEERRRNAWRQG